MTQAKWGYAERRGRKDQSEKWMRVAVVLKNVAAGLAVGGVVIFWVKGIIKLPSAIAPAADAVGSICAGLCLLVFGGAVVAFFGGVIIEGSSGAGHPSMWRYLQEIGGRISSFLIDFALRYTLPFLGLENGMYWGLRLLHKHADQQSLFFTSLIAVTGFHMVYLPVLKKDKEREWREDLLRKRALAVIFTNAGKDRFWTLVQDPHAHDQLSTDQEFEVGRLTMADSRYLVEDVGYRAHVREKGLKKLEPAPE